MSKNKKIALVLGITLLVAFFVSRLLAEDEQEITQALHELNQPITEIGPIAYLNDKEAIVFYESEHGATEFGHAFMEKGLFGWEYNGGSTYNLDPEENFHLSFSNLEYRSSTHTDLLSGAMGNPAIETMRVETESGQTYDAGIIEYDTTNRFWFLLTEGDNTIGSIITGLSENGEIIEQRGL